MPLKVEVGPPQIAIHHGQTVLVTDLDAQIDWPSDRGLFFFDTRVLSSWAIYANGVPWELLNGGATSYYTSKVFLTNRTILTEDGAIAPRTLGLVVSRSISGGMHEDLDITNNSMKPVRFQLEIVLRSDFADIFEVKSNSIVRRGRITTEWSEPEQQLRTRYRNADFMRSLTVSAQPSGARAVYANGRLSFEVSLAPGEAWHCCLLYSPGGWRPALSRAGPLRLGQPQAGARRDARGLAEDGAQDPHLATRSSIASIARRSRTWRRCGCPSPAPTIWCSCPQPACPGSLPRSAATA